MPDRNEHPVTLAEVLGSEDAVVDAISKAFDCTELDCTELDCAEHDGPSTDTDTDTRP